MAKIAVLIPTYEPESYIKKCLLSLDRQTLFKEKFNVYIALNGPIEPYKSYLEDVLESTSLNYILVCLSESGVSNARNHLLDISNEPYITFIDDDDIVSENYLQELFSKATPSCMSICNVKNFEHNIDNLKPNYIGKKFEVLNSKETSKFKSRQYYSSPWAKMLHRRMIGDVRFEHKLTKGEDSLFMAKISKNIEGIHKTHPSATYYVYERPGSATRSPINRINEIKRIGYLISTYSKMLFSNESDKLFIASRIAAVMKHCKYLV